MNWFGRVRYKFSKQDYEDISPSDVSEHANVGCHLKNGVINTYTR
ncbi:MAG: hypothetical protein QOD33_585 [Pyrinomonadaceae bacterium]|jgi:hypothetical protein|nr:hypothetical protein [Pyrinomonadaceae bacterium]